MPTHARPECVSYVNERPYDIFAAAGQEHDVYNSLLTCLFDSFPSGYSHSHVAAAFSFRPRAVLAEPCSFSPGTQARIRLG
jgi:hypothetical protein